MDGQMDRAGLCESVCVCGCAGGWRRNNTKSPGQELTLCTVSQSATVGLSEQACVHNAETSSVNYTEQGLTNEPAKPAGTTVYNVCVI